MDAVFDDLFKAHAHTLSRCLYYEVQCHNIFGQNWCRKKHINLFQAFEYFT